VSVKTTALPRGQQTVTAVVDPKDRVAESDETNNRASRQLTT
jgi:subtilase family serine protease